MPAEKPKLPQGRPEIPEALAPWWRIPIIVWPLIILVGGGLFAALGARPTWRYIKERRADKIFAKGEQFLAEDKISPAIEQCRLGFQLAPNSSRGIRLMAESLSRVGARSGLDYWQRLLAKPEATTVDREAYAELALREGLVSVASNEVVALLAAPDPSVRAQLVGVRYHLLRNESDPALDLARKVLSRDPANPTNLLSVAILLQTRSDERSLDEARTILWRVATNIPSARIEALELLSRGPAARRTDREQISSGLASLPTLGVREQVILAETRMLLEPSQTRAIADAALNTIDPQTDQERLAVALWLNRNQLHDLALPFLTINHVRGKPALFRARIDALISQARVEVAYRELLGENSGIEVLDLELLRLRCAEILKDGESAARHREQLLRSAGRDPDRLKRVAEFAERSRLPDLAKEAWKSLTEDKYEARRALRALAVLANQTGDTWAAREYFRKLAKLEPDNPVLRLQLAHHDLLLGEDPAPALKTATALADVQGLANDARFISALALLRSGEEQKAADTLRGMVFDSGPMPVPLRVIFAAVAGGIGESNRAAEVARSIPISQLRPEERDLIRPYLIMPRVQPFAPQP